LRQIASAVLAAAVVVSCGAGFATAATAMNVCGISGCAPVLVKRVQKPPPAFTAKAVPLVVSGAQTQPRPQPQPQPVLPSAPWPLSLLQQK
jgi:hypothetical protein